MALELKPFCINVKKKIAYVVSKKNKNDFPCAEMKDGKYRLPWETEEVPPDGWEQFKSFLPSNISGIPRDEVLNEDSLLKLLKADPEHIKTPPKSGIRVTWLGHATALFQLDSANLLVNPNFNARGIKYYHPGNNKRYRQPVYSVEQLPRIDCVFITNTHFDYLDLSSVRQLNDRFGEMILWYVPKGACDWMKKAGCNNVVEMDWWKEEEIEFIDHTVENEKETSTVFIIVCTPSQSYHNRAFNDDNAVLWCSWVIRSPRYKIFISGSSGYTKVFQSIGRNYGPFHMAALPIGGYDPKSRNGYGNLTPEQAVQVHKDVLAACSLALSWGTFSLSDEHYLEPPYRLNNELKKLGLSEFFLLKHGESRLIEIKSEDDKIEAFDTCFGEVPYYYVSSLFNGIRYHKKLIKTREIVTDSSCPLDCCGKELSSLPPKTDHQSVERNGVESLVLEENIEFEKYKSVDNTVDESTQAEHHDEQKHETEIKDTLAEEQVIVGSTSEVLSLCNKENKIKKEQLVDKLIEGVPQIEDVDDVDDKNQTIKEFTPISLIIVSTRETEGITPDSAVKKTPLYQEDCLVQHHKDEDLNQNQINENIEYRHIH